ncbi:MAG: acyl-CoA dehydrogenase family protein [Thermodesulfobacteriota bacterium]|nr:acyl-CoA dehydrogenase family protein [Thermodesulfobacteriota bacterium]
MDFEFSEEQQIVRQSIASFMKKECSPEYVRWCDENAEFPQKIWKGIVEMGLLGASIPEEYGGTGGDIVDQVVILEELTKGMTAIGFAYFLSSCFGGKSIGFYGSEEQKKFYLKGLAEGRFRVALGLTEPGGGTDILDSLKTKAVLKGDNYIVNGQKVFITGAQDADYIITVVRTGETKKKTHGLSILIIKADSPGLTIRRIDTMGLRSVGTNEIFFEDVVVPAENILGRKDNGWYHLLSTLNNERITAAALSVGMSQAALDCALQYVKEREAFGRPIGQFQAVQHKLANAAKEIELSRLITYKAAWLQSKGETCHIEAAMAKLAASETCWNVANAGMQVMGGYGFSMEYDMQRFYRDSSPGRAVPINNEMILNLIGEGLGLPRCY